jgi:NADPH:quinone reductase
VIATARAEDHAYLRALGAGELVDRDGDVAAAVRASHPDGIDALIDLISYTPDDFNAYAAALAPGGRAASPLTGLEPGPGRAQIWARPDPALLDRLGEQIAAGTLQVRIQQTYPLEQAGEALAALAGAHTQGKLAISLG